MRKLLSKALFFIITLPATPPRERFDTAHLITNEIHQPQLLGFEQKLTTRYEYEVKLIRRGIFLHIEQHEVLDLPLLLRANPQGHVTFTFTDTQNRWRRIEVPIAYQVTNIIHMEPE